MSGGRGSVAVVIMTVIGRRSGMAVIVVTMSGGRGSVAVVVVAMLGGCRMGRMGVLPVSGVRSVTGTMTMICAVIAVRLVLVTHCYSVPRPLFAVFAAKSV
jgi:hypothetical protein